MLVQFVVIACPVLACREQKCTDNHNTHFFFYFALLISILVISNHNSFRVLFDKTASVYFI